MKNIKRSVAGGWLGVIVVVALAGLGWFGLNQSSQAPSLDSETLDQQDSTREENRKGIDRLNNPPPEYGRVTDIVDSVTVIVDKKYFIRYLGVVTPTTIDKVECLGKEALLANESMLNRIVRLDGDPAVDRAQDGAWLRYVWVADNEETESAYAEALDGLAGSVYTEPIISPSASIEANRYEVNVEDESVTQPPKASQDLADGELIDEPSTDDSEANPTTLTEELRGANPTTLTEELRGARIKEFLVSDRIIEMGLGFPLLSKDMKYYDKLSATANYSRATGRGLWGRCEISQGDRGLLKTQTVEACNVKGIVTKSGEKIYRTLDCRAYERTAVLNYQGGEWLCSEDEAREKGYGRGIDCNP